MHSHLHQRALPHNHETAELRQSASHTVEYGLENGSARGLGDGTISASPALTIATEPRYCAHDFGWVRAMYHTSYVRKHTLNTAAATTALRGRQNVH